MLSVLKTFPVCFKIKYLLYLNNLIYSAGFAGKISCLWYYELWFVLVCK